MHIGKKIQVGETKKEEDTKRFSGITLVGDKFNNKNPTFHRNEVYAVS